MAKAVLDEPNASLPLLRIILWARRVNMKSADEDMVYREGMTGSHLEDAGMDQIIIPCHVSSVMLCVLRLSTAALLI